MRLLFKQPLFLHCFKDSQSILCGKFPTNAGKNLDEKFEWSYEELITLLLILEYTRNEPPRVSSFGLIKKLENKLSIGAVNLRVPEWTVKTKSQYAPKSSIP